MAPNLKWIMGHNPIHQNNQISQEHNMRIDHTPSLFSFYLKSLTKKEELVGEVENGSQSYYFYFNPFLKLKQQNPLWGISSNT